MTIAGYDIEKQSAKVRRNVGIIFQNPSLDLNLTKFMDEIKKRTGVKKLSFNKSKYNIILNGNIKDKNFEISFEKV